MPPLQSMQEPLYSDWSQALQSEKNAPYFIELLNNIRQARESQEIYPAAKNVFRAFKLTPLDQVRAVILGQDPYHGPGQADGLAFSVPKTIKIPPSLHNIYRAMKNDGVISSIPTHGDLSGWAKQGIFLLNTVLTVQRAQAHSHAHWGWARFTDRVLQILNARRTPLVFFLWGSAAQQKKILITNDHHLILCAPHPSPLSAHRGFLTAKHFFRAQQFLKKQDTTISWEL